LRSTLAAGRAQARIAECHDAVGVERIHGAQEREYKGGAIRRLAGEDTSNEAEVTAHQQPIAEGERNKVAEEFS
jgi:hypothetical protein